MKRSSPSLLVLAVVSAAAVASGCGGGVSVLDEGSVDTGGGSVALSFADVTGAGSALVTDDVIVASPMRGEVDVLVRKDASAWRLYGSFYGGGATQQVLGGHIGGGGAVLARNQDGSVALLAAEPGTQHRLSFPVQIYHRLRNQMSIDGTPPAVSLAVADLDGDGDADALVSAPGLGVVVLPKLAVAAAPGVNPEKPPTINGYKLSAGASPSLVTAVDLDGDHRLDVAALDAQSPSLRTYHTVSQQPLDIQPVATLALPAIGVALHATGCPSAPLVVTLADGRLVALTDRGTIEPLVTELTPVHHVAASGDALALDSDRTPGMALFDACGGGGALLGLPLPSIEAVAMTAASPVGAERELAVLEHDGRTVQLFHARNASAR